MENTVESLISNHKEHDFLSGGGEMGSLIRSYDWTTSPVGPISGWPQSLRTTLSILLNSKFPMFLWWGNDLIQFYNDNYRPSFGNEGKHPKALGQKGVDCWPEIWPVIKPLIDQVMAGGESTWSEDQFIPIYRNGKLEDVYWTFSYSPVKNESGKVAGVLVVCNETTEKVINEDQLKFAIEATELGTWDFNPATNKLSGNNRLKEWFGLPPESFVDLSIAMGSILETDKERVTKAIEKSLQYASGGHYDIEYTIINPRTKKERIVRAKGRAWFNDEKVAYRFNGTLQDITLKSLALKKVEDNEKNLRNMIMQSPVAMCILKGIELIVEIANERMFEIWGKDNQSIIGRPLFTGLTEAAGQGFEELLSQVYITGKTFKAYEVPVTLPRSNGIELVYVDLVFEAFRDSSGKISGVMAVAIEVTEKVIARKKIEEETEKKNVAISVGELGVFEVDINSDALVTDKRFNELFGFENQVSRKEFETAYHPEDLPIRNKALKQALVTGTFDFEARTIHKNNSVKWVRVKGNVIYNDKNEPEKLFGVIQDITEQKTFSESLTQQVRERTQELHSSNEDLLRFAHVASHDLKEPLRKVKIFSKRLQDEYGDLIPDTGKSYVQKIHNATERMFSMIEGVLTYSELSTPEQVNETVDLNNIIRHIEADLEVLIQQKRGTIKKDNLPVIEGASVLIYQLFYNLINNSLKFSKPDVPAEIIITSSTGKAGGTEYAKITLSDNGIGLEPNQTTQIFNAFERLNPKDKYEGTGLGLALCKKIAERHHGAISATGELMKGAEFTVTLPVKQGRKII